MDVSIVFMTGPSKESKGSKRVSSQAELRDQTTQFRLIHHDGSVSEVERPDTV
jgi:hypothetical protein